MALETEYNPTMGVRWLVNGVFYREPWYPVPQDAHIVPDPVEPKPAKEPRAETSPESPPAFDPYELPIPPPNSEVAARPMADLEHRIERTAQKGDPLNEIEKSVGLHNRKREPHEYSTITELMSREVKTVTAEMSVEEALDELDRSRFHHLPVVDHEGCLVGLVSDRDLLGREGLLAQRMQTKVLTATEETGIQEAAKAFVDQQFHSLVVVNEEQRPTGMITSFDLLRFLVEHPAMQLWQSRRS